MKNIVIERVKEFITYKKYSQEELRKDIGVRSKQQVSNWFSGAENMPDKHIVVILKTYPELNANWLINGFGMMLNDESEMFIQTKDKSDFCEECLELKGEIRGLEKMLDKYQIKNQNLNQQVGELITKLEDCNEKLTGNGYTQVNVG